MVAAALPLLMRTPAVSASAGADSLAAETVPPGSIDPRALSETGAERPRSGRLHVAVAAGPDSLAELFVHPGRLRAALRADATRRNGWVALRTRSFGAIAGGVRATFAAGALLGRAGSALASASSPPRAGLVRVAPSTSLWLPTRGVALEATRGRLTLAAVRWEGSESLSAAMGAFDAGRWRLGMLGGRVAGVGGVEAVGSVALGVRGRGCHALLEAGARGAAVNAVLRCAFGRRPRWTAELGTSAAAAGFGANIAAPAVDARRRLRMAVSRTGRAGPLRVRTTVVSASERRLDASRRQVRAEADLWWATGSGRVSVGARFDRDERVVPPLATQWPATTGGAEQRVRLRAGCEADVTGVRQTIRLTLLLGPGSASGTLLEWGMRWNGRRTRLSARVSSAALAPGQKAWFARPDILGREGLGVATGTLSDAALRAGVRVRALTFTGWIGTGSRRGVRAYIGAAWEL